MSHIDFYTNPMSRSQIVRWALHEVGADYEARVLAYGEQMNAARYLAINPMGKVPAIVHEGKVVTECAAICAYLADTFPAAGLAPGAGNGPITTAGCSLPPGPSSRRTRSRRWA